MSVQAFVSKTRQLFNELVKHRIVIGNQAADLDSIVSSISLSYYLSNKNPSASYIPVINSTKSVLKSKKECMFLIDYFAINFDDLIFINEFHNKEITHVALVDHNELDNQEMSLNFSNLISIVIDHHLDKNLFLNANPRIVDTSAGSNATLIAELIKEDLNESFASMLVLPILFDTNYLTTRASQKDCDMVKYLSELSKINCQEIYKKLDDLRFNSGEDEETEVVLSKDYKQYSQIKDIKWGMSSVNLEVNKWLDKENTLGDIDKFMIEKNLDFYGVLSMYKKGDGDFKRDIGIFSRNESYLNNISNENLNIIRKSSYGTDLSYLTYQISKVTLTRKYWQPFLEEFLKAL